MKTLMAALITALLVFILATGWTELVQPQLGWLELSTGSKSRERSLNSKTARTEMTVRDEDDSNEAADEAVSRKSAKASRSARQNREEIEKTKAQVARQLEVVKKQESKLVAREEHLRMLYDDIHAELLAIEEIRQLSAAELAMAEQKVQDAAKGNSNAVSMVSDGSQRIAGSAKVDRSAQASIAGMVQDLASRGSIETAAGLLRGMKDREIAKVLTSLSTKDPRLANQLFEQIRTARFETTIRR